MGKGDIKSKKGKRFAKSFGNSRPHKAKKNVAVVASLKEEVKIQKKRSSVAKKKE